MLNRRKLILALAPAAILPTASTTSIAAVNETGNANFAPSFFSPDEWRFINAAVARLVPGDGNGPGGIETGVPEFIDRQMEAPYGHGAYFYMQGPFHPDAAPTLGYELQYTPREIYRVGIADANKSSLDSSGKSFSDLTPDKQDGFLEQTEKELISFERIPAASFFAQLSAKERVKDTWPIRCTAETAAWPHGSGSDFREPVPTSPTGSTDRDRPTRSAPSPSRARGADGKASTTCRCGHHRLRLDRRHHGQNADRRRSFRRRAGTRACTRHIA